MFPTNNFPTNNSNRLIVVSSLTIQHSRCLYQLGQLKQTLAAELNLSLTSTFKLNLTHYSASVLCSGGCVGMFVRRVSSQLLQLQSLLLTVFGLREPTTKNGRADLVRDDFGLHKVIFAVTSVGKVGMSASF